MEKLLLLESAQTLDIFKTFRQLYFSVIRNEKEEEEDQKSFFGIYRFVAHEHSVAELIFHIIENGRWRGDRKKETYL